MADKRIEIQMATVGADAAATAIKQTVEATKELASAQVGLKSSDPELAAMQARLAAMKNEAEALGEKATKARALAEDEKNLATEDRQAEAINMERAKSYGEWGRILKEVGEKGREMGEALSEAGYGSGETISKMSEHLVKAGNAAMGAAEGFRVAGPMGAALGAAMGYLAKDAMELAGTLIAVKEATERLKEEEDSAAERHEQMADRMRVAGIGKILRDERNAASELIEKLNELNEVGAAKDKLEIARIERAAAQRIQGGEDPESVDIEKTKQVAEVRKTAIDREINAKRELAQSAAGTAVKSKTLADESEGLAGISDEEKFKRRAAAEKDRIAAEKAFREYNTTASVGEIDKNRIAEETSAKVDQLIEKGWKRKTDEEAKSDRSARDDKRKRDEGTLENDEGGLDSMARQRGASMSTWAGEHRGTIAQQNAAKKIGGSLMDGTDPKEIEKLQAQVNAEAGKLGLSFASALNKVLAELRSQGAKVDAMKEQIKNSRTGR